MTQSENVHHEINYIEISALNIEDAKRFYAKAFGWEFNEYGPTYLGIRKKNSEGEVGGICQAETNTTGGPLVILYSTDLEASLQNVKEAGGDISLDIISFPGGRRFQFHDPSGNELGVWSDQPAPN